MRNQVVSFLCRWKHSFYRIMNFLKTPLFQYSGLLFTWHYIFNNSIIVMPKLNFNAKHTPIRYSTMWIWNRWFDQDLNHAYKGVKQWFLCKKSWKNGHCGEFFPRFVDYISTKGTLYQYPYSVLNSIHRSIQMKMRDNIR